MAQPNIKNFYLPVTRQHVLSGAQWGNMAGTDYWLVFNPSFDIMAAAATTVGEQLAENGWTATSMANTAGSGGDFAGGVLTKATVTGPHTGPFGGTYGDAGTPNHALTNATGDLLDSPAIFGDAAHMEMAAIIAGKSIRPRYLIADFWAAFTVASADETTSAIGFFEDGGSADTEADQYAVVRSNGVNFLLQGNAATLTTLALISTTWHKWKIVLEFNGASGPNIYAYIDGARQSATAGVGLSDEFPLSFGMHSLTTNRQGLGLTHIYYDW